MLKFQNKYRIESSRFKNWDYSTHTAYFITINTKNRYPYFGEMRNGKLQLNQLRETTRYEWLKTRALRPDMNLELGAFVVMPDHFHGIIIIGKNIYNSTPPFDICIDGMYSVSANVKWRHNQFGPQSKNLGSIIRGFKSAVTTNTRKLGDTRFNWQERFYDRVIRDRDEWNRVENYILNNPSKWENSSAKILTYISPTPLPI